MYLPGCAVDPSGKRDSGADMRDPLVGSTLHQAGPARGTTGSGKDDRDGSVASPKGAWGSPLTRISTASVTPEPAVFTIRLTMRE